MPILQQLLNEELVKTYLERLQDYDTVTYEHSLRVGRLSIRLGDLIICDSLQHLGRGALLHDIGKLRIPLEILTKTAPLTEEEQEVMDTHPRLGLSEIRMLGRRYAAERAIIAGHHEYQPREYPRRNHERRTGERASPERRTRVYRQLIQIVALADFYDALAHPRPYKPALAREEIEAIIRQEYKGNPLYIQQILAITH